MSAWPLWMPKVGRRVQSLDTEAPKVWQGGGGEFIKWGFITAVLYNPDTCGTWTQTEIFRLWMVCVFFFCPPAGLADTADDARGSQKQQG